MLAIIVTFIIGIIFVFLFGMLLGFLDIVFKDLNDTLETKLKNFFSKKKNNTEGYKDQDIYEYPF